MTVSPKIGVVSLGCPKALVDTERILTQLRSDGYEIVPTYEDAELVIVNTCGFIDEAKAESLDAIGEALTENGRVIVTGCLGAKAGEIEKVHPSVLAVTGPQAYESVVGEVHRHVPLPQRDPYTSLVPPQGIKLTPRHYAYLKISEGCNHSCTFCIIPSMRGKLVSRPAGDVLGEAERLAAAGVRELLVISQDTSAYGADIKYCTDFWNGVPVRSKLFELCDKLSTLGMWVRLHYVYPYPNVDDLIPLMADGRLLPYLDIPFQHGSPKVLKLMKRPAAAENTLERIEKWRSICPEIAIRSTFIVGFPGETENDFEELLSFLETARLDRVGCFKYSPVDGARANELHGALPKDVKEKRFERFMAVQARISLDKLKARVGSESEIIIDRIDDGVAVGRSKLEAPDIDGVVYIEKARDLKPGDIVPAVIESHDEHDLWARVRDLQRHESENNRD